MKKLIGGGLAALAVGLGLAAPANAAGELITYVVESNGPLLSINYYDGMNEMTQLMQPGVSLVVEHQHSQPGDLPVISIAAQQPRGRKATCRIIKNGTVTAEQTTVGRYTMSVCASA